jgi:outer membrane immunogenic protein
MNKSFCAALFAMACAPAAALAADLPRNYSAPADGGYAAPLPVFTWTGFYAGANGGLNFTNFTGGAGKVWGGGTGGVLGVTGGYNWQYNQLVIGAEGDFDLDTTRSTKVSVGPVIGFGKMTDTLTLRARAGVAIERSLLYVTGGYVGGTVSGSVFDTTLPAGSQYFSAEGWRNGYTLGAGIEYAFSDRISGKAEYLYESLTPLAVFSAPRATNAGASNNVLRGGVNYHF